MWSNFFIVPPNKSLVLSKSVPCESEQVRVRVRVKGWGKGEG
jgi:hypothetical protein